MKHTAAVIFLRMDLLPRSEAELRLHRFQSLLGETPADAAFIYQNADQYYFSGTVQAGLLCIPVAGEPIYLVQKSLRRAQMESPWEKLVALTDFRKVPEILKSEGLLWPSSVGLEMDVLPARQYLRLQQLFPGARFLDVSDQIRRTRMVKSPLEVDLIRAAAARLDRGFADVGERVRPGVTEIELAADVESALRRQGHAAVTRMRAFNSELGYGTVSSGPSAAYPTCFQGPVGFVGLCAALASGAGWRAFAPGETVMVDIAGNYGGYVADITRVYPVSGPPPAQMLEAHAVVRELMTGVEAMLRPGTRSDHIYQYALDFINETPFADAFMGFGDSRVRFLGHGVGLELDELPVIAHGFEIPLESGMAIALEPKIFFPDRGGVGIEDTYIITPTGFEKVTLSPDPLRR